jgi:hypothetical protein
VLIALLIYLFSGICDSVPTHKFTVVCGRSQFSVPFAPEKERPKKQKPPASDENVGSFSAYFQYDINLLNYVQSGRSFWGFRIRGLENSFGFRA